MEYIDPNTDYYIYMNEIYLTLKIEVINKLIKNKCSFVRFYLERNICKLARNYSTWLNLIN